MSVGQPERESEPAEPAVPGAGGSDPVTGAAPSAPLYERVGGQRFFDELTARFEDHVGAHPQLRALYPEDMTAATRRLALFLGQYWGGPQAYSAERGHPRLRMRHARFRLDGAMAGAWLDAMAAALGEMQLPDREAAEMWSYLTSAAEFLRNAPDEPATGGVPAS